METLLQLNPVVPDWDIFSNWYDKQVPGTFAWLRASGATHEEAGDALQQAASEMARRFSAEGPEALFTEDGRPKFLGLRAHSRFVDARRRAKRFEALPEQIAEIPGATQGTAASLAMRDAVGKAVGSLPADLAECVRLRYWADLPLDEIAAMLNVPEGTVASRLFRAHKLIAKALGVQRTPRKYNRKKASPDSGGVEPPPPEK